jgi:uncharacterized protein (DUF1330 family)
MSAITPNPQQFQQLAMSPDEGPVTMLNLLKFKARADDGNGSGADAYGRCSEAAVKMVEERGGRIIWQGRAEQTLVGDEAEGWDIVALVEYPSRKTFIEMVSAPGYIKTHEHRAAGLERTVLIACKQLTVRTP